MIDSSASNVIIVKAKIDDETLEPSYYFHSLDDIKPIEIQGKEVKYSCKIQFFHLILEGVV